MRPLRPLPGVQPVAGSWLRVDDAYAGQMAQRAALIAAARDDVHYMGPGAREAAQELLEAALAEADWPQHCGAVLRPDGHWQRVDWDDPMVTLGHLFQCDFVLMDRAPDAGEHRLVAAILCFPASWSLAEKAGRPLTDIHAPVKEYDADIARRVQRLFDGVQVGRPLWRFNGLWYDDPDLFQPRKASARREVPAKEDAPFYRAERQTILRLPRSRAVVFAIHTYVVARGDL